MARQNEQIDELRAALKKAEDTARKAKEVEPLKKRNAELIE